MIKEIEDAKTPVNLYRKLSSIKEDFKYENDKANDFNDQT